MDNANLEKSLEELKVLTQENNHLLHDLHSNLWWSRVFSFIRWAIIIGSTIGLFYYFQPLMNSMLGSYKSILQQINTLSNP